MSFHPGVRRRGALLLLAGALSASVLAAAPSLARSPSVSPALNGWTALGTFYPKGTDNTGGFAVTGPKRAVVAYRSSKKTYAQSTADGGVTWSTAKLLSPTAAKVQQVTMASFGALVDVLSSTATAASLRRSTDGGKTWGAARAVAFPYAATVMARGPKGVVALLGFDAGAGRWVVKVSTDGGTSFGPLSVAGNGTTVDGSVPPAAITVTTTGILVLFRDGDQHLAARRTVNAGASWSDAVQLSAIPAKVVANLATSGDRVVAVFTEVSPGAPHLIARRSTDGGLTWSAAADLDPGTWAGEVGFGRGAWHLVHVDANGSWRYRSSADGLTWSDDLAVDLFHGTTDQVIGVGAFKHGPAAAIIDSAGAIWIARR